MNKVDSLVNRLVQACPALPYMAFALWQAWLFALSNGSLWLSDTEINGTNITMLFTAVTGAAGVFMLIAAAMPRVFRQRITGPRWVMAGSLAASFACFVVIIVGPYYLGPFLPGAVTVCLFVGSGLVAGAGMAPLLLRCGRLYSELTPRRAILYVAASHMAAALLYFVIIGSPAWALVPGGPSLCGMLFFMLLPIAACAVALSPPLAASVDTEQAEKPSDAELGDSLVRLPKSFTKLVIVVFVFSAVLVSVHAAAVQQSTIGETVDSTRSVMLLRLLVAVFFVVVSLDARLQIVNLSKVYSSIMAASVVVVSVLPALGLSNVRIGQATVLVTFVFEMLLWCIASFATYQKKYSPVAVFGWAYGAYLIGNCLGWALGAYELSLLSDPLGGFIVYVALAVVVLVFSFVVYSEKEFDALFEPESEEESSLQELLAEDISIPQAIVPEAPVRKKFTELIDELAQEHGLSNRETDVFRCLAMGYDAAATAERLGVSWNTVRTHTRNVYAKLGVHSKQELIDMVDARRREDDEG